MKIKRENQQLCSIGQSVKTLEPNVLESVLGVESFPLTQILFVPMENFQHPVVFSNTFGSTGAELRPQVPGNSPSHPHLYTMTQLRVSTAT